MAGGDERVLPEITWPTTVVASWAAMTLVEAASTVVLDLAGAEWMVTGAAASTIDPGLVVAEAAATAETAGGTALREARPG